MKLIKILDNKDNIVLVADRKTTLSFLHSKIKDFEKPLLRSLTSIRLRSVEDIQIRHKFYKECLKHIASNTDQYGKVGYFSYSSESMPNIMMRGHHRIKCGEWVAE